MQSTLQPLLYSLILLLSSSCSDKPLPADPVVIPERPTVSFTFDDGITHNILEYKFAVWNAMILEALETANLKAIFFVTGFNKLDDRGQYLLRSWDEKGHKIANHTYTHPNFNDEKVTVADFKFELHQTDSIIRAYDNYIKLFRFPYLKEGKTKAKIDGIRAILDAENYQNGHVTIDASDWYINSRLIDQLKNAETVDTTKFAAYYLDHLLDRAQYYEELSYQMNGRHIKHTLLLHHNLTSALFLDQLIERFQQEGWDVIDAEVAYTDSIYQKRPMVVPAGESLIWSLAKESGQYEHRLRYPAEDSRYEEAKMDQLGL